MNPNIIIRSETDADPSAISEVTVAAFQTLAISNHTEQFIIAALRAAGALAVFVLSFDGHTPQGTVAFHDAFKADGRQ